MMNNALKQIFFVLVGLTAVTGLFAGAYSINQKQIHREQAAQDVQNKVMDWHLQVSRELPSSTQKGWKECGQKLPIELLRACTAEQSVGR